MGMVLTCPICRRVFQDWNGFKSREDVERSFRGHLVQAHKEAGSAVWEQWRTSANRQLFLKNQTTLVGAH